jgi:hypothetical protein
MLSQDGTSDLEQLLVVVCQDPDGDEVCPVDLDPDVVLKACQNLVVEEGRYDSTYNPHDVQDRDDLGSVPPYGPNLNSSDFLTYAFHRVPLSLPLSNPNSVSRKFWPPHFLRPDPPPFGYGPGHRFDSRPPGSHGFHHHGRHYGRPHDYPLGRPPPPGFPPPPLMNLSSGAPPQPTNRLGGPPLPSFPHPPPPNPPPPGISPPVSGTTTPPTPPGNPDPLSDTPPSPPLRIADADSPSICSSSTSPLPPSSPVLRPPSPVIRSLHIPPPPSTPSWARPLPPSLFAGPAWTRRRQLRFSHLSVQEYCEKLRWTPQVSHCFAAKICLLFLSHLDIQEQAVPDRSSTFSGDGMSWRTDDLRTLPSLELALTNSMFRSVRNFADSFWIYNVQRSCSQMAACQDRKLIAALANFLGFPGKTSLGFERWLRRFNTTSHIIWSEATLLPAFWSVNDRRRTAKPNWAYPIKLQFHDESRLVTCFFGLDRILLPSVSDLLPTWGTELVPWAEGFLSGDACASFFSHMSSIPLLSSMLEQLPEEITTKILWRLVNSVKSHCLEYIYSSSFLDYSTLCLNLAELIHLLQDSNCHDMCGKIVCSLLYPGFSPSFVSDARLWKVVERLMARGANIGLPFRAAMLAQKWHDMVQLIECGFNPGTDSLALVLAESPYTRHSPSLDLCHALVDQGADVNANYQDSRYQNWLITPLIAACIPGEPALINWLLSAKANVNTIPTREDHNKIPQASCSDGQASGDFQLQKTSSPSTNTELKPVGIHSRPKEDPVPEKIWYSTPLIEACARGHGMIFGALIAAGANVNAVMKPYVGRFGTALVAACAEECENICWILLHDRTIDITTATWRILRARPKYLKSLDALHVPVYTNPLVTAASNCLHNICRELIERGADVNAIPLDKTGEFHTEGTALIKASAGGHLDVCKLLVKHGADVNIVVPEAAHYPTALFAAARHDRLPAIGWLLSQGAGINKLLLSRFPDFCDWILDSKDTKIIPLWLFAEESGNDTEDTDDVPITSVHNADDHGMISAELASRLFSLGIRVNQDAIRSEGSIESTEPLLALECGSKLSDEIPERTSQQAGSVNQRVMFGFLTEVIFGKHGNETRSYNLVSTLSCLDFDVPQNPGSG